MILNDNKVGNYWVRVFAGRNSIASFECPSWADVELEVNRIADERAQRGLPTSKAQARQLLGVGGPRENRLGPVLPVTIREAEKGE